MPLRNAVLVERGTVSVYGIGDRALAGRLVRLYRAGSAGCHLMVRKELVLPVLLLRLLATACSGMILKCEWQP